MNGHSKQILIVNKRGLHARASAKFVAAAAAMDGTTVTVTKDSNSALGGSILGLMMLGAAKGDTITLTVEGEAAAARLVELAMLVETGFGED
ncbi:HPr family phosphocarrier protein [Aurantiacibacter marinus]|uniref:Serine kinase n=1 Tax=Aurantiacibacter marinus TaxID=874156 RepID=A0A0H0XSG4_9SPHN|nr:HPr family phosphocarrier protein [Aurantiacibacter marinus]KLI63255.1 serine kinase [Aurantiacibacter marinus]